MNKLKKANKFFRDGNFEDALKIYKTLVIEKPILAQSLAFNINKTESELKKRLPHNNSSTKNFISPEKESDKLPQDLEASIDYGLRGSSVKNKIAIVFHAYHEDVIDDVISRFCYINSDFDLYVTTSLDIDSPAIKKIRDSYPNMLYRKRPNRGRDVLPFLDVYNDIKEYDICLKIHTKKGMTNYGDMWRQISLDSLLGSVESVKEIIQAFRDDEDLVIGGPEAFYGSGRRLMYGNSANINKLCEFIGLKYDQEIEWGFFAGTMFWFRPAVYETLAEKIREINFGREEGKQDGGVEHAIERMFGLIPSYFKKKGLLIYPKDDSNKLGKKEKIVLPGKPDTVDPTKKLNSFAKKILQKNNIVGDVNKQSVGALADMKVRGWIAKLNDASPRCFVLRIGNEEIEGVAVHYRGDLEDHGINNGCHAFEVPAPLKFANGKDVEITLFDKSTGMPVATAKYKWSSVSRSYSDFNSYLTWSYTGHYVQVPFVEADKRAFAVMELIADDLQRISSNSFDYPLISIIMPTYNRGSLISDAIDSVLNQTYFNWELIIVDDASSDDSRGVVSRYADGRVKYYRLDENGGVSRARNYGLQKAKGEFIAYLDSDNSWDERYLSAIHGAIKNINSNVNALYTGQIVFKGKNKDIEGVRFGMYNKSLLLNNNYIDLNCFVHKKTIEGFDLKFNESIPRFVDWEFIARMSLVSPIYSVPVLLSYYNLELADNAITSNAKYFSHYEGVQTMITNMAKSVRNENNFSVGEVKDRGISVVIPSFNAAQDLKDCLDSLKSYMTRSNFEVIIVDNNSADEAISVINEFCSDFPKNSSFISLDRNFGYTFAVNKGLNSVKFKNDVLLLNNDAVVVGNALDVMQNILHSDDSYGISAPAQILPGNTETITTHVPYAVPETEVDVNISAHHKNLSVGELFYSGGPIKVDFVPFFCVLIKREVLDVAPNLDHRNGRHYRSDRTYCSYIKAMHDFSVVMVPDAIIYHKLQKSTKELNKYSKLADDYSFILKENAWMESEQIEGGFKVAIWNKSF